MIGYESYQTAAFCPPDSMEVPDCECGCPMEPGPLGLYCPDCDADTDAEAALLPVAA